MIMKSAYYISSSQTYSSMVEEDAFISYSVGPHTFNQPAIVTIELADDDGSIMRKYDVDTNAVYVGPGAVEIWEPDASCVFMGRVIKARHNEKGNRVTLLCQDWMSQLGEERIKYDMREDIDGAGLRQSIVRTHIEGDVKKPVARSMKAGVSKDAAVYNDETTETNSDTVNDMTLLPAAGTIEVGDGFLFGFNTGDKTELTINISTAGVGSWYVDWDYSTGAGTWGNLSGVTDNTIGFKTAGVNKVTWTSAPGDWAEATYDGKTAYWVKGDIDWITVQPTTRPLGAYAHGDYFMYDDNMRNVWGNDDWNGKYVVFPSEAAGSVTISTGPRDETVDAFGGGVLDTDLPIDGEEAVWDDDHRYHHMADNGHAYYLTNYQFFMPIEISHLFNKGINGARVKCEYNLEDAVDPSTDMNRVFLYDLNTIAYYEIGKLTVDNSTDVATQKATWEIPEQYLDYVLTDDDGECKIQLAIDVDTATPTTATLKVHKIRLEVDVDIQGYANAVEIFDTQVEAIGGTPSEHAIVSGISAYNDIIWQYTDQTTEVNNATVNDVMLIEQYITLFPGGARFYFATGGAGTNIYAGLKLIIGTTTPLPYAPRWQYSIGSDKWKRLLDVKDNTNGLSIVGTNYITWTIPDNWAMDSVNGVGPYYWIRVDVPYTSSTIDDVLGTRAWFINYGTKTNTTKLLVDRDLTTPDGVGVYEGMPYCITNPINTHINGLVTGGDDLMTLTTDVESTTGISTRHYDDRTRFEIMLDLAKMDSAVCWVPLGTKQVKYKSTFAGSTTNLTDSDVISWDGGEYSYPDMYNEFHIGGIRIGDNKLYTETELLSTDPGSDSKTKYGASRTKIISSTGTVSQHDTEALGTALVEANEDVHLYLECVIAGLPTGYRLGTEINVTSAYLGLTDQKYVVTSFSHNSKSWRTKLTLHPRTSSGFVDRTPFGEHLRRIGEQSRESMIDSFVPGLTTQRVD